MASSWWQAHHGKLVEKAGGPVICDYDLSGYSSGTPAELLKWCNPSGVGIDVSEDWGDYWWLGSQGSLQIRVRKENKRWYLQAARSFPRLDRPEGPGKRYFVQTAYLLLHLEELEERDLFQLPGVLVAEPMTQPRRDLAKVQMSAKAPRPLPGGDWFQSIRPLLEAVASGQAASIKDDGVRPDDFFLQALLCLACLPAALRWRIPIGGGFCGIPDGFGLSHGMRVLTAVRRVAGQWKVNEGVDLRAGRAYANWLEPVVRGIGTVEALYQRIAELLPDLNERFEIDADLAWPEAMSALKEALDLGGMRQWLRRPEGSLAMPTLKHLQGPALKLVIHHLSATPSNLAATELLPHMSKPDWAPVWRKFAETDDSQGPAGRALGMLLNFFPFDIVALRPALGLPLPSQMYDLVASLLTKALRATPSEQLSVWSELIRHCGMGTAPGWLRHWFAQNDAAIVWLGLRLARSIGGPVLATWDQGSPALDTLRSLRKGSAPANGPFKALCAGVSLASTEEAREVAVGAWQKGLLKEAISLAEAIRAVGGQCELGEEFSADQLHRLTSEQRAAVASKIAEAVRDCGWHVVLFRPLLILWEWLPPDVRRTLVPTVAGQIGQPWSSILLGYRNGPQQGPKSAIASQALPGALNLSAPICVRAIEACSSDQDLGEMQTVAAILREWYRQRPVEVTDDAALCFLDQLQAGICQSYPELTMAEAGRVAMLVSYVSRLPPLGEPTPGRIRAFLALAGQVRVTLPELSSEAWVTLLRSWIADRQEYLFVRKQLRKLGWGKEPFWRLCPGKDKERLPLDELLATEEQILEELPEGDFVKYLLLGGPVTPALFGRIRLGFLRRVRPGEQDLEALAQLAMTAKQPVVVAELFRLAVSHLDAQQRKQLAAEFKPKSWLSGRTAQSFGTPWGTHASALLAWMADKNMDRDTVKRFVAALTESNNVFLSSGQTFRADT